MKTVNIMRGTFIGLALFFSLGAINLIGFDNLLSEVSKDLNFDAVLTQATKFASKISTKDDVHGTTSNIVNTAQNELQNLPSHLLGLDVNQLTAGLLNKDILNYIPMAIHQALLALPSVIYALENPDLTLIALKFGQPLIARKLANLPQGQTIKAILSYAITLLDSNSVSIGTVSKGIASILKIIEAQLKSLDLKSINIPTLITMVSNLQQAIKAELPKIIPNIEKLVQENAPALKNIIDSLKGITMTTPVKEALKEASQEVKSAAKPEPVPLDFGGKEVGINDLFKYF